MTHRFFHRTLASDVPLPSLPPAEGGAELRLRLLPVSHLRDDPSRGELLQRFDVGLAVQTVRRSSRALQVLWEVGEGAMLLRIEPRTWVVRLARSYAPEHGERALLTICKKLLLGECGEVFLHASCVARGGRAFAFVGPTGAGKSTLAGALAAFAGHDLFADDAFPWTEALEVHQGPLLLQVADGSPLEGRLPWTRLERLPIMTKSVFRTPVARPGHVPLAGVFLLEMGPLAMRPVSKGEAMLGLLPFLGASFRPVGAAGVQRLRDLVERVPMARLAVPRDADVADTARAVADLLAGITFRRT